MWYDLGPALIPPIPAPALMTDRDTAELWHLKTVTSPAVRLVLTDVVSALDASRIQTYGPFDGPWLADSDVRLFVRGGRLGFEYLRGAGLTWPYLYARAKEAPRVVYRLQTPLGFTGVEALAFELVE